MKTATETKPIWQIANEEKNKVKALLMMLKHYTLDPTFINYGNFCQKVEGFRYSPSYRKEMEEKAQKGYYTFSGNFFDVSHCFNIETNNKKDIDALKEAIQKNKETPEFKKAFTDRFNAIKFTKTFHLTEEEMKVFKTWNNDWWITSDIGEVLPISELANAPKILEKLKEQELKHKTKLSDKNPMFEIEYFERHYLPEEWEEILELFDKHQTVVRQFMRITDKKTLKELKEYEEITFKSTGRKILAKFSKYHMSYIEK